MIRHALVLFLLLLPAFAAADSVAWTHGLWFDGTRFVAGDRWSVNGVFVERRPVRVDRIVDLANRHVVPAFGDAHHHGIDSAQGLDDKIAAFLEAGIFYVKNPNVIPDLLTPEVRRKLDQPDTIHVSFSNGGLTASGGHPAPLHAYLSSIGVFPGLGPADMEDRAYFVVDDEAALEKKWPAILAGKPAFVKTFLLFSEEFEKRRAMPGVHKGLDPRLLPAIVARAHAAGLRVSTHIDTAADFRHAVEAGVDEVNHLPQPDPRFSPDLSAYVIDAATAKLAASKGIVVVSTASTTERLSGNGLPAGWLPAMRANQRANLRTLREAGVAIAVGSDGISGERTFATARDEVRFIAANGLADNLSILRMWSVEAPRTIFPRRRLGGLDAGYEASFLVLGCDPIAEIACVERIAMRVKQGFLLPPMAGPVLLKRG
jgi:cytosine/adenosine deaminase-related metal-dependent hydrolase